MVKVEVNHPQPPPPTLLQEDIVPEPEHSVEVEVEMTHHQNEEDEEEMETPEEEEDADLGGGHEGQLPAPEESITLTPATLVVTPPNKVSEITSPVVQQLKFQDVRVDNWGNYCLQRLQNLYERGDFCDLTMQFHTNQLLKVVGEDNLIKKVLCFVNS